MNSTDPYFPTTLPNAVPVIGPRSYRRPKVDNLASSVDAPISSRITDKSLLASLHRDTTIKIRQPTTSRSSRSSKKGTVSVRSAPKKLKLYPPEEPPKFPTFNVPPHRRKTPQPELSEITEDFMEDQEEFMPDNIEDCRLIKSDLKKLRLYQVGQNDYDEALNTHKLLQKIDEKIFELDQFDDKSGQIRHSMTKHQEIEQVVASYLEEWDKAYEEFLKTTQNEIKNIEDAQSRELEEFDNNIPKGLSIEFRKASPRLLNLRSAEKRLAYSNQIEFAMQIHQRANRIEQQEADNQYRKQSQIIEARRERLIKKHEESMKHFLEHVNSMRIVMIQSRNKTVGGYLKRLNYIDKEINAFSEQYGINPEDVCPSRLDEQRAEFVIQEEMNNPISSFRAGKSFVTSRRDPQNDDSYSKAQTNYTNDESNVNEDEDEETGSKQGPLSEIIQVTDTLFTTEPNQAMGNAEEEDHHETSQNHEENPEEDQNENDDPEEDQ